MRLLHDEPTSGRFSHSLTMFHLQDGFTCMTSMEMLVREAEEEYAAQRGLVTTFLRSHW